MIGPKLAGALKQRLTLFKSEKFQGIFFLLVSTVFSSLSGLFCKLSNLNGVETSWGMGVAGSALSLATFCLCEKRTKKYVKLLYSKEYIASFVNGVLLRGLASYVYFLSLDYIMAADSLVVVLFVSIIWATLLEALKFGIRPHWLSTISAMMGVAGMVCLCQPQGLSLNANMDFTYVKGVLFATGSGCFGSTYYFYVRKLEKIPALWHWVSYPMGLMFLTKPEISINNFHLTACSMEDRIFGLLAGVTQVIAGLASIKGTQLTLASASFVIKLFGVVLTFLLQLALLPNPVTINSIIGGACILLAMVLQFLVLSRRSRNNNGEVSSPNDQDAEAWGLYVGKFIYWSFVFVSLDFDDNWYKNANIICCLFYDITNLTTHLSNQPKPKSYHKSNTWVNCKSGKKCYSSVFHFHLLRF